MTATRCDLGVLIAIATPVVRARYEFAELGTPRLRELVLELLVSRPSPKPG